MIKFKASVEKVSTDRDGYSKLVLEVPQSELQAVISLMQMTERCLDITVQEE